MPAGSAPLGHSAETSGQLFSGQVAGTGTTPSSSTSALTFSYTVGAGQNAASLAVTGINLNGATVTDGSSNAANLSPTGLTETGPQIDTTTPSVSSVATSGSGIAAGTGASGTRVGRSEYPGRTIWGWCDRCGCNVWRD